MRGILVVLSDYYINIIHLVLEFYQYKSAPNINWWKMRIERAALYIVIEFRILHFTSS